MLATLAAAPLADPNLIYEPKYDGIRALVTVTPAKRTGKGGGKGKTADAEVTIASRVGNDKTVQFPELVHALARWGARRAGVALLDGEIVALDRRGAPAGFQRIQDRIHLTAAREIVRRAAENPIAFVAFDLLRDGDEDLCPLPLVERRRRLEAALAPALGGVIRLSTQARGDGAALMAEARAHGWEGLVVKEAMSPYRPGRRSGEWRKVKLARSDSFVVGGYTEPRGARNRFGALLLGVAEPGGRLRYVGHVGGGFSDAELDRIARLLRPLEIPTCPFAERPATNETPHWTRPVLVVEVRFSVVTDDGVLREPTFLGLREDTLPAEARGIESVNAPRTTRAGALPDAGRAADDAEPPAPAALAKLRAQLDALVERGGGRLELPGGAALPITNLAKRLWPRPAVSKADLFRHYLEVAPLLLPALRDRPLVMRRYPDGIEGHSFFQHRAPDDVPAGVRREAIAGDDVPTRLVGGGLTTLLYMVQLASISQDPWFSRAQSPAELDFAAIDLDPMEGVPFARVRDVARWVRDELASLGVDGHLKTSGARGLHIYLPMRPGTPFEAGQLFCRLVASVVAGRHPDAATVERAVKRRPASAVYLDCLQNGFGKTLAAAYSARASAFAGVSTPLAWAELDDGKLDPRDFTIRTLPGRLRAVGDLWAGLRAAAGIDLDAVLERAGSVGRTPES
jgi:bifunctional non-homologous end joining protein LigD